MSEDGIVEKQAMSTCYSIDTSKMCSELINTIEKLLNELAIENTILLTFPFQGEVHQIGLVGRSFIPYAEAFKE